MNVRKTLTLFLVLAATAVSAAQARAPVGTDKANGIYTGSGWTSQRVARSGYRYRPSATFYGTPAVQGATAPELAQSPTEDRRFSYDPSAAAISDNPCQQEHATASAPVVNDDRRFSYEPTEEAVAAPPVQTSRQTYSSRPSYSRATRSGAEVNRWALPKTDARKFND